MNDAVTLTLIILTVAMLRWSLLTGPDAAPGVRSEGRDKGFKTLVPARIRTDSPHPVRKARIKR